ncbi:hypothetical protein LB523_11965 [Mesorhizobium sp. ESP-6-4]|uniref:hypothetical protein n=1 Tax=Mesorhizobium sp. ESP-6-4 TaxID=2876624 RepID=UPI001CCFC6B6|nr:hypothetical protein [Mesorhizobium sp. ESP-6-4]MBZ9659761.1 hypothetical protein [Mesorhizobium sp. ESP-6-4]
MATNSLHSFSSDDKITATIDGLSAAISVQPRAVPYLLYGIALGVIVCAAIYLVMLSH